MYVTWLLVIILFRLRWCVLSAFFLFFHIFVYYSVGVGWKIQLFPLQMGLRLFLYRFLHYFCCLFSVFWIVLVWFPLSLFGSFFCGVCLKIVALVEVNYFIWRPVLLCIYLDHKLRFISIWFFWCGYFFCSVVSWFIFFAFLWRQILIDFNLI